MEKSISVADVHHLRLMALLHELVREKGNRGTAVVLGIDSRTVASSIKTGRLSWRVQEALERGLQSGAGSAAARQRKRNDALDRRVEELEGQLRRGLKEVRADVAGEVKALLEQQAKALRQLERRLAREGVDMDRCLFVAKSIPRLEAYLAQLSQPEWKENLSGHVVIDKAPEDAPSPDLYDATALAFAADSRSGLRAT